MDFAGKISRKDSAIGATIWANPKKALVIICTMSGMIVESLNDMIIEVMSSIIFLTIWFTKPIDGIRELFNLLIDSRTALNIDGTSAKNGWNTSAPILDNAAFMFANAPEKVSLALIA